MTTSNLDSIFYRTTDLWPQLAGKSIFIAGLGFYGKAFLKLFTYVRDVKGVDLSIHSGTRSSGWNILRPDTYSDALRYSDYVLNCVLDCPPNASLELLVQDCVVGPVTLRNHMKHDATLLHFSSGAVGHSETPFAKHKGMGEKHLLSMSRNVQIVRPFATVGPDMGLVKSFAISTFIKRALAGLPLEVSSHPISRSFCHISDLIVQCLHVMVAGDHLPSEVGSNDPILIEEAARLISDNVVFVDTEFPTYSAADSFVADIEGVKQDFNIDLDFSSKQAILDVWHTFKNKQVQA